MLSKTWGLRPRVVECFFCSCKHRLKEGETRDRFFCWECKSLNYFDKEGEFVPLLEWYDASLNRDMQQWHRIRSELAAQTGTPCSSTTYSSSSDQILCDQCLRNIEAELTIKRAIARREDSDAEDELHTSYDEFADANQFFARLQRQVQRAKKWKLVRVALWIPRIIFRIVGYVLWFFAKQFIPPFLNQQYNTSSCKISQERYQSDDSARYRFSLSSGPNIKVSDRLCRPCAAAMQAYWESHYHWFVNTLRESARKNLLSPAPPHVQRPTWATPIEIAFNSICYLVTRMSPLVFLAWSFCLVLGLTDPIILPSYLFHFSDVESSLIILRSVFSTLSRAQVVWSSVSFICVVTEVLWNPLGLAYSLHKKDNVVERQYYFKVFGSALRRYHIVYTFPSFIGRLIQFSLSCNYGRKTAILGNLIVVGLHYVVLLQLANYALLSYSAEYSRGAPKCHLSDAEIKKRLNIQPCKDDQSYDLQNENQSQKQQQQQQSHHKQMYQSQQKEQYYNTKRQGIGLGRAYTAPASGMASRSNTNGSIGGGMTAAEMFSHIPKLAPTDHLRLNSPCQFGANNVFRPRMDIQPAQVNKNTIPTQFTQRTPQGASAFEATIQRQRYLQQQQHQHQMFPQGQVYQTQPQYQSFGIQPASGPPVYRPPLPLPSNNASANTAPSLLMPSVAPFAGTPNKTSYQSTRNENSRGAPANNKQGKYLGLAPAQGFMLPVNLTGLEKDFTNIQI